MRRGIKQLFAGDNTSKGGTGFNNCLQVITPAKAETPFKGIKLFAGDNTKGEKSEQLFAGANNSKGGKSSLSSKKV